MKSSGEGYTPFRVASFSREGALSASDDKRGVGKAGGDTGVGMVVPTPGQVGKSWKFDLMLRDDSR